jgi:GTP cyclohydrolase II
MIALTANEPTMLKEETFASKRQGAFFSLLDRGLARGVEKRPADGPPLVTLAYAQSLDGSIAAEPGRMLRLSNPLSQAMTHHLRARHDAILVGINTVLTDDPRLTVRLTEGKDPRPVVIDGQLRTPIDARLVCRPAPGPIIATSLTACPLKEERLREKGALVMRLPCLADGRLDLKTLLARLALMKISSVMVEGGALVLSSFLAAGLVDQVVVTISPRFIGGLRALAAQGSGPLEPLPRIRRVRYVSLGGDLIVWGSVKSRRPRASSGGPP